MRKSSNWTEQFRKHNPCDENVEAGRKWAAQFDSLEEAMADTTEDNGFRDWIATKMGYTGEIYFQCPDTGEWWRVHFKNGLLHSPDKKTPSLESVYSDGTHTKHFHKNGCRQMYELVRADGSWRMCFYRNGTQIRVERSE